jgi:1-acyl-sn-glycerol-3-phosphate acyltransferase
MLSPFRRGDGAEEAEFDRKLGRLQAELGPLGVDPFGFDPKTIASFAGPVRWLYRHYFRVLARGVDNVPDDRVLLVSNHSGQLPFDGLMIAAALLFEREPPRVARSMVERWVPRLPFVSVTMARLGQVVGTPENCRRLLEREEAILVFPEGVRGLSKPFRRRYRLARFGTGFMRLALQRNTPVVPVSVVGAEEQAPALANFERVGRALGAPAFPITPTFPWLGPAGLLPLPTRYRIRFGAPLRFEGEGNEEDEVIRQKVEAVRSAVQNQIDRDLAERTGIFT